MFVGGPFEVVTSAIQRVAVSVIYQRVICRRTDVALAFHHGLMQEDCLGDAMTIAKYFPSGRAFVLFSVGRQEGTMIAFQI